MIYLIISFIIFFLGSFFGHTIEGGTIIIFLVLLDFSVICARIAPFIEIKTNIQVRLMT